MENELKKNCEIDLSDYIVTDISILGRNIRITFDNCEETKSLYLRFATIEEALECFYVIYAFENGEISSSFFAFEKILNEISGDVGVTYDFNGREFKKN